MEKVAIIKRINRDRVKKLRRFSEASEKNKQKFAFDSNFWGHAIFSSNGDSKSGLMKSDAATATVIRYARDPSVKKTKTGKVLTPELRQVYQGVYDGFYEAFSKADRK